jgi:hypothetical protein
MNGRHALAHLAMRILAVVPNSAGVERLFSMFGIIHSKRRNRLSPEVVRKSAIVKADTESKCGKNTGSHSEKRDRAVLEEDDAFVELIASIRRAASSSAAGAAGSTAASSPEAASTSPATASSMPAGSSTLSTPSVAAPAYSAGSFGRLADELIADAASDEASDDADDEAPEFVATSYTLEDIRIPNLFDCAFYNSGCFVLTSSHSVWSKPENVLQGELDLHDEHQALLSAVLADLNVSSISP